MSGNEGLLYKKLSKEFEENFGRGDEGVGFIDVKEVLDEANQDFPEIDDVYDYNDESRKKGIEKLYEILKWKEKWIGSAEK